MRRSSFAPRIVAFALASGAIALAGCPATPERPAAATNPATEAAEIDIVEVVLAEAQPHADPAGPSSTTSASPDATATEPPSVATESGESAATGAPAVTIEGPSDFLRPSPPDAALRDEEPKPADPPVQITDRSAEAEDPNSLPGGTPIDDLFEGLEDKPSGAPNE